MKRFTVLPLVVTALFSVLPLYGQREEILKEFPCPSMEYRPRVWWHWMNGNVTREGIRKDLQWMKESGVGGVQVFDAGLDIPTVVRNRLSYMSDGWKDAFNYAAELADSLGLEFAIAGSGGWSDTGGPWVTNEQAMKELNWKEFDVMGGGLVDRPLPEPNCIAGKYLTHSFFPVHKPEYDFYRDIAVVAVKVPDYDMPMEEMGAVLSCSDGSSPDALHDGDLNGVCRVAPGNGGNSWIQFSFPKTVTVRSFFYGKKDDYQPRPGRHWEVSDDGVHFKRIDAVLPDVGIPFITIDLPETSGRHFRFVNGNPGEAMDYTELRVYASTRVNLDTEKAAFFFDSGVRDFYPTPFFPDATAEEDALDLTSFCKDGRLVWNAPEGRWRIYRFGYTLRGRRNNPASPEATGLESDKLSPKVNSDYYRTYLDMYNDATGGKVGRSLTHLMLDSYEAGSQTWTDDMMQEFRKRRSYDLLKWLPALAGHIIGSSEQTDRFLQDWRRTIGEMMVEYHYDGIDPILEEYGLKRYTEFHEGGKAFHADGMAVKKNADIPMGAVWTRPDGLAYNRYMTDIRESASVAHIYGQNVVAAEAFTTDGDMEAPDGTILSWNMTPERMKGAADMAMANGLNCFVIHCSVHQPVDDRVPGLSLSKFGAWFQRHETWAHEAAAWTGYLSRSSYLLRQGRFVADVAYLVSETVNIADRFREEAPSVPEGFAYDFVNRDVVCSGQFGYGLLMIDPEVKYMSLELLEGLRALAERGVIIAGGAPEASLGLHNDEGRFRELVNDIWHSGRSNVVAFGEAGGALSGAGFDRDVDFGTAGTEGFGFVHRRLDDGELYFISSVRDSSVTVPVSFNVYGRKPQILRADSGTVEDASYRMENGRTTVYLDMTPRDAQFVLFGDGTDVTENFISGPSAVSAESLDGGWIVRFQSGRGAPECISMDSLALLSTHSDPSVRFFSGTATYSRTFKAGVVRKGDRYVLSLDKVFNMARVRVNGVDCGLAWRQPFEIDITSAVRGGRNSLEIEVTGSWANRIIGDTQPGAVPVIWVSPNLFSPQSPLCPSGLGGPVVLKKLKK